MTDAEIEEIVVEYVTDYLLRDDSTRRKEKLRQRLGSHAAVSAFYNQYVMPVLRHLADDGNLVAGSLERA